MNSEKLGLGYDGSCKLGHHLCFDCWEKAGHKCPICDQTQKDRIMTQKESINQAMETGNDCTITLAEIRAELWQAFDHFEHHDIKKARECLVRAEKEVSVLNLNFKEMRRCIDSSDESIGASIAANGSAPQFPAC